jgi:hypothetical protein
MTERFPSIEQASSKPVVSVFLIMSPILDRAKIPFNANRRGDETPFDFAEGARPPRATVSGLDVEAPSGRWTLRRINDQHAKFSR